MKVFIAIDLPEEVRQNLAVVQRELRGVSNTIRWVSTDSAHLTLKFLGEITDEKVEEVHQVMANVSWKQFQISVKGVGFFPGALSPRVLWAGMHAPTLETLAERIDSKMETFGFEKERRKYRPHITLARAKRGALDSAFVTAASQFEERDFGSFLVDRCFLYRSDLQTSGHVYTKLREYPLT